ncbi:MAG: hypothetical protein C0P79_001635 [Gammaproteobacteria bacterium]|nr:hypothetical protein [Gammaproteobacteria bacterium]
MRAVFRTVCRSTLTATAALLGACVSSVVVDARFPAPLIEPLPVRMGILYDEELKNFVHVEALPQQSAWTIDLGDANLALLSPLFERMFAETRTVDAVPVAPALRDTLDGVIRPRLEKFEFDVPIGERDEFVEVWMQYQLTLYNPDGSVVTEWPVSGYGKAELTGRREDSVRRAAVIAMREVGAAISTKFAEQPDVSYWLRERQDEAALSADLGS